jgi:plastocyanin
MKSSLPSATRLIGLLVLLSATPAGFAAEVAVTVVDRDGLPVADVAVYAEKPRGVDHLPAPSQSAVMDQVDKQFVPHVLIVQTGTSVEFPNSDTVAHHVYSFSHPNKFKLPMYKGTAHPPITFEYSGVVVLGCNIHDHMLGYILVVDSAAFAKTDADGTASLTLESLQDYEIRIWSPRIRDGESLLSKTIPITPDSESVVSFRLARKLSAPHGEQLASWQEY